MAPPRNYPTRGVSTFLGLTDVDETTYVGSGTYFVQVKATEDGLQFTAGTGSVAWGSITGTLSNQTDLDTRFNTIEDKVIYYEIFEVISTTSGTVTKPTDSTIILNRYEDAGDALIVELDTSNRPIDDPARESDGTLITTTFDVAGNYSLSGTPASANVAIIYQISIKLINSGNVNINQIVNSFEIYDADKLPYDNTSSGLTAVNVQDAIDEIDTNSGGPFTDNAIIRGDGGGKAIQDSGILIDDSDNVTGVVQFSSSGDMAVNTNTLFVDVSEARVGIGTATPACELHLYTATGAICERIESADANAGIMQVQLYNDSSKELSIGKLGSNVNFFGVGSGAILNREGNMNIICDSNDPIIFYTDATDSQNLSATEKMRLSAAGYLGMVTGTSVNEFSIDGTLADDSDDALPTEKAVKTYIDTSLSDLLDITKEPTGFTTPGDVVITGDSTTRKVTLTGTVNAYYRGVLNTTIVTSWVSDAHGTDTNESYFLYYDGNTISWNAVSGLSVETFYNNLLICLAFYNTNDSTWVYLRECHSVMPWQTHRELHQTVGTYRRSGGTLADYTLDSTTAADRRPSVSECLIYDEDLPSTLSVLAANGPYTQFYLSSTDTANFITAQNDIIPLSGNQPYWNEFTGGAWQQTLMSNNYYTYLFLLAVPMAADTPSQNLRYIWVQGQSEDISLANIQAITANDVTLGQFSTLLPEYVGITKIIIQYTGANWKLIEVSNLTGTSVSQVSSPAGNYLSSVTSDATLTGQGTPSVPLGIDLTNANTWSGIQTFSAQITSTVTTGTAPLVVASTTLVDNLNADQVDGKDPTATPGAAALPLADGSGKLDSWITDASLTAKGKVELATAAETTTGTDATRAVTPDGLAGSDYGKREVHLALLDDTTDTSVKDGIGDITFTIPVLMNGWNLVDVEGGVEVTGTTGTTDIQIYNITQTADMLSTKITIDSGEYSSLTAATPPVIDTANDDVSTGDRIRIDCDAIHSGTAAKGLWVKLTFQLP